MIGEIETEVTETEAIETEVTESVPEMTAEETGKPAKLLAGSAHDP